MKSQEQFLAEFGHVNTFYAAPEGLKRPGGMVIDTAVPVQADIEAMGQWGYQLAKGATVGEILSQIRASEEWKQKHSGETPPPPPPPVTLPPLRIAGKHFTRAGVKVLPLYIHMGDLISRFSRDRAGALKMLDEAVLLRADGVRVWTYLLGLPFWRGRTFQPNWDTVAVVVEECQKRGLQLVLSQGDVWQLGSNAGVALRQTADFIRTHDPNAFDIVDGGNETWHNGQGNPENLAHACRVFANLGPIVTLTDAPEGGPYADGEEGKRQYRAHMARWCQSPANLFDIHSQAGDPDGCIRRTWNAGYETNQWLRVESETRGPERNVTVCNRFSRSQVLCLAAAGWISGAANIMLSSPGVISDGTRNGVFDAGESFLDMPGFRDLDTLRRWLPQDVMGWKRVHGGARDGSPRVFATNASDDTRADHAINEAAKEYICVISGNSRYGVTRVRNASEDDFPLQDDYRIVKGQLF
jgi:hypothetical protein